MNDASMKAAHERIDNAERCGLDALRALQREWIGHDDVTDEDTVASLANMLRDYLNGD